MFSTVSAASVPGVGTGPADLWHLFGHFGGKHARPPARLRRPVVSVGNLSFGGRGKTPTVAHLARLFLQAGARPGILTRGYGRRRAEDGVVVVSDSVHLTADVDRSGDEPLMLARELAGVSVFVCDERAIAGTLAERAFGVTVHLLDDGFQHVQLGRDLDLVIVSAGDLRDRPAPFGRLRESTRALARADAIILDEDDADRSAVGVVESELAAAIGLAANTPTVFALRRSIGDPIPLESHIAAPDCRTPVAALAGIAQPVRFFRTLEDAGWSIAASFPFRDHHRYRKDDLQQVAEAARRAGASGILTTAKDAIRLLPLRPFPLPIAYVPLAAEVEPADVFRAWILDRVPITNA